MASSSKNVEGKEVLNIQLASNEVKQPIFKAIPNIAYKKDPSRALSIIPLNVLMVQDVRNAITIKLVALGVWRLGKHTIDFVIMVY